MESSYQIHQSQYSEGRIVILHRTFDTSAPLMHDYSYTVLVDDLMKDEPFQYTQLSQEKQQMCFNKSDQYWELYKSSHISEAGIDLEEQISEYTQENANFKQLKSKASDKLSENELLTLVRDLPQYQQTMLWFGVHRSTIGQLFKMINDGSTVESIELEQLIMSGVDPDKLKEVPPQNVYKDLKKFVEQHCKT